MKRSFSLLPFALLGFVVLATYSPIPAMGDAGHSHEDPKERVEMLNQMKEEHLGHEHGHDFEAMENVSTEEMTRLMGLMMDVGLVVPPMDVDRGRDIFLNKGCVVCHSVNDVGGILGPPLDAADMPRPMNAFEFAARMWRGAPAMALLQEDILGEIVALDGQDLADLIAFAHDEVAQAELSTDQILERFRDLIVE